MCRPKIKNIYRIQNIINKEINKFTINETLNNGHKTPYKKILKHNGSSNYYCDTYRFTTNNNNSYDVEFYEEYILFEKIKLINGNTLPDKLNEIISTGIIISFTPTETKSLDLDDDVIGSMNDPYQARTNRNEQYEIFCKIIYLVEEYMKNNSQYNIYVITKNTQKSNLIVYKKIYENIFINDFIEYETEIAYYYIKK